MAVRRRKKGKENPKILKRMQRRLWIVFGAFSLLFAFLIFRLMFIQYTSGDRYKKIVLAQQEYDSTIIPFRRGNIVDSRGTVLATSIDVYNVILDAKVLNSSDENKKKIDTTLSHLSECFPDIDIEKARDIIKNKPNNQYTILQKKVSYENMKKFSDLMTDKDTRDEIEGIWFEKQYERQYPYNSLAAQTVGFVSGEGNGVYGVESEYNSYLNGTNGREYGYLDSTSGYEKTVIEPKDGDNVTLSIDVNIQSIVETAIKNWNDAHTTIDPVTGVTNLGSKNTAVVVMNPNNAEILAEAQYPTFDLNNPYDLDYFYTGTNVLSHIKTTKSDGTEKTEDEIKDEFTTSLWSNFPVQHTYEPGSTFKPFTIATGLDTGTLSGNETYFCNGGEQIGDHFVKCSNHSGHGQVTVKQALEKSCNDALMQMSYVIGGENFYTYQRLFGFGQKTGVDLPGEPITNTLLFDEEGLSKTINLATNSFGQNFNVTMLQMAAGFSSIINGGTLYVPHVATEIRDSNGNVVDEISPTVAKKTISSETSAIMRDYLRGVVVEGTGSTAGVPGYDIGGKTGTAEKQPRGTGNYLVSFIGFAPVDDPQVVVYTIVDIPNTESQAHSTYAQEIEHAIFEQLLPYMGIEPTVPVETTETDTSTDTTQSATTGTENTLDNGTTDGTIDNGNTSNLTEAGE